MDDLKNLRDRIDWLDSQIAQLLDERMRTADQVGKIKKNLDLKIEDQSREKVVLNQVETIVRHPVLKAHISKIYCEIMQEAKIAQQFFRHLTLPFRRIGIIGLGLMGGSLCKALKMKDPSVEINSIIFPSQDLSTAYEGGWIDQICNSYSELILKSELIILASPISTIVDLAKEIQKQNKNDHLLVIDIASVKRDITQAFESLTSNGLEFLSTHPMAGREKSGFENSQATLFVNRPWIVIPHSKNNSAAIACIQQFIQFLGGIPKTMTSIQHDQQTALISHLPLILSKKFFDFVNKVDPDSQAISGPGFQDFTRLAHHQSVLRSEISTYNKEFISGYLQLWIEFLKEKN